MVKKMLRTHETAGPGSTGHTKVLQWARYYFTLIITMALTAKLTEKYQATFPKEVREALSIDKGDRVFYEVLPSGVVLIRKATPLDMEWSAAIEGGLEDEWSSKADDEAYRDL